MVVLMENKAEKSVIASSQAPYLNRLAAACAQATAHHGVTHPSLPNYLALTGGDTYQINDDASRPSTASMPPPSSDSCTGTGGHTRRA